MPNESLSLQEKYAPDNACWGCGPANPEGLRIRSFAEGDAVVAEWQPEQKYEAFPGVLNGGIIGTLLDCHCNWTAAYYLMKQSGADRIPCTVTADYAIKLLRPTPTGEPVHLSAIYAAAQNVPGVDSVHVTTFQRLGMPDGSALDTGRLDVGRLEIARLDNDPNFAERGLLRLTLGGGR